MRTLAAAVVTVGLEALLLLSGAGCGKGNELEKRIATPTVTVAPAVTPSPAPTTPSKEQEQFRQMQKTLIEYYTAAKGQNHYDDSVYSDLLLMRHYVYNPVNGKMGVVVSVEGLITSIYRVNGLPYFGVTPFSGKSEASPYVEFVMRVLPEPKIDYETAAPGQLIGAPLGSSEIAVPIGVVGEVLSQQPAKLTNPFGIAREIAKFMSKGVLPVGQYLDARSPSGQQLYVVAPTVKVLSRDGTFVFAAGSAHLLPEMPSDGVSVVEQVILDTQAPQNMQLLEQLRKRPSEPSSL
ncbi:hypothetical protein HYV83_03990 [Candidatus Woesearchaeota archaeon]|nr:hypothetical protein [Candidatus Woesearchaeota archaeon]